MMNYDEIQQQYAKVMGRITNDLYHGGLEKLRNDASLDEHDRMTRGWNIFDSARDMARQATAERNERLAERERILRRKLFGAPAGITVEAVTKAAFTDALGRAAAADDEALERMSAAASQTGDRTLGRAVFSEAERRGLGALMNRHLLDDADARGAFGELSEIPSAEERERSLERAPEAIPEPRYSQVAPSREAQQHQRDENAIRPMAG